MAAAGGKRQSGTAHRAQETDLVIFEGTFSWWAAWCMMIWILGFIVSVVLMVLSTRGEAFVLISEEVSFIKERNPPHGPVDQPNADSTMREINQPFRYMLPQTALFYSLAASALGMFSVSYFTSFMLMEDQGSKRVVDIGRVISKGVRAYLERTIPMVMIFLSFGGLYVFITADWRAFVCFVCGASMNLISARVGVSVAVHGQTRLAHSLSHELFDSVQLGIRTGSIGGLLSTSLALGGLSAMWLVIRDTLSLSGFGSGACIVSFYLRIGGGIFSKGADIGADLVGAHDQNRTQEDEKVFEMQQKLADLEETRRERQKRGLEGDDEDIMAQLRAMEVDMQDIATHLHPIDYLDAVGENVNNVSGQCADLFESMVLILSTCTIIGTKGSPVPYYNSGLPFYIAASGKIGSAFVAYYCHVHERFSAKRIRWSLRFNLLIIIVFVQIVQGIISFQEYMLGNITLQTMLNSTLISTMGQLAPELCVFLGDFFTSVDHSPVRSLAMNADLGVVQVVLQGFGQGFLSTGFPALTMIVIVVTTWQLEGHYGLALLSASSVAGTGFQGGIASYGAIAANAHKIVHLTTYNSMTRHRANICASLGGSCSHAGDTVAAINGFSAVFNITLTLLAQTYTSLNQNYMLVKGSILSNYSQAGLVLGVVMTFVFAANTMISCLDTSREFYRFCTTNPSAQRIDKLPFPQSHMKPLKILTAHGTFISMRMVFSPMINTLAAPLMAGMFLGVKGLLFMISGANVLILCLSIFLINSGKSWAAARKFILFGLLRNSKGEVISPDSVHYQNLGVGEMIGGPFEGTTGPALNNFIKFVAVFAFVTGGPGAMYDETPDRTWPFGILVVIGSLSLVAFTKVGLNMLLRLFSQYMKERQRAKAFEEGEALEELALEDEADDELALRE